MQSSDPTKKSGYDRDTQAMTRLTESRPNSRLGANFTTFPDSDLKNIDNEFDLLLNEETTSKATAKQP